MREIMGVNLQAKLGWEIHKPRWTQMIYDVDLCPLCWVLHR